MMGTASTALFGQTPPDPYIMASIATGQFILLQSKAGLEEFIIHLNASTLYNPNFNFW